MRIQDSIYSYIYLLIMRNTYDILKETMKKEIKKPLLLHETLTDHT